MNGRILKEKKKERERVRFEFPHFRKITRTKKKSQMGLRLVVLFPGL